MRRYISDEPVRYELVKARVTFAEKAELQRRSQEAGLSVSELVRQSGVPVLPSSPPVKRGRPPKINVSREDTSPTQRAAVVTQPRGRRAGAQPDGRKGILYRTSPKRWRQLRDLAADLTISGGTIITVQSLIDQAVDALLGPLGT